MWVKSGTWQWYWTTMAAKGGTGYRLQRSNDTNAGYFGIGQTNQRDVSGTLDILDEKWHHLAGIYNGETVRLYVDGIFEGSSDASDITAPFELNGDNLKIGDGWNGNIDMVRLYDRGLNQKLIRDQFVADGGSSSCGQVYSTADLNQDCYINLTDVALMAAEWLDCTDIANTAEYGGTCVE
jgi:Concanavalin A-like lectin/glucanases superfamily